VRHRRAKDAVLRAARSSPGQRALAYVGKVDPFLLIEALGPRVNRGARFSTVKAWPDRLQSFEDLAFLFSSNQLHHAVISMSVVEAAYLFRLARSLPSGTMVEIGRSKGGSTLLLATAMDERSRLVSYDLYVKHTAGRSSDEELEEALDRYGLSERVELVVADSRTAEGPADCALVLVDGDHSYEGVRADWDAWRSRVRVGGHVVFHDAASDGDLGRPHDGVAQLMSELEDDETFVRRGSAGTLVDFERVS
jgi:predicted O-methyltransferase YrrM